MGLSNNKNSRFSAFLFVCFFCFFLGGGTGRSDMKDFCCKDFRAPDF